MLVLSRKCHESVVVGGSDAFHQLLRVTVLDVGQGKVKLGFEVDPSVPIHREEIWNGQIPGTWRAPAHPNAAQAAAPPESVRGIGLE